MRGTPMSRLGRSPLEQPMVRDEAAIPDPQNGIQSQPGLVRKQCRISHRPQQVVRHLREGEALQPLAGGRHGEGLRQRVEEQLHGDHKRRDPPDLRRSQPGGHEQTQAGRGHQAPAQVVENLPTVEPGERVWHSPSSGLGNPRQNPIRDLPITANPAMLPAGVAQVTLRELVIELNIAGQAHPDVSAFNQVMAQQPLFRKPPGQHSTEGAHIIDPLAMVGAFTGEILIDVGNGLGVWINSDRVCEESAERRAARARQGRAHARLDDGVRAGQDPACGIEARLVERVCQGLDHPAGSAKRELCVAVQRDDEPHIGQMIRVADVNQTIGIFRPRSIDQTIEFFHLPPFAFPTDEFLLGFTPGAVPMEKEETLTPIPMVESFEALGRRLEQSFVVLAMRLIRIGVVREEAEEEVAFFVGQVPDL